MLLIVTFSWHFWCTGSISHILSSAVGGDDISYLPQKSLLAVAKHLGCWEDILCTFHT